MRYAHGRFFMTAGDELRRLVTAVVDQRFLQPAETRTWVRRDVFKAQRLYDIDHKIGSSTVDGQYFDLCRRIAFDGRRHLR